MHADHPSTGVNIPRRFTARPLEDDRSTGGKGVEPMTHMPRSATAGVMHNCGHDVHAAILLGLAALVRRHSDHFAGTIVFLFQPAEETAGGADDIVADGVLKRLGVEAIFAEHVAPGTPVGTVGMAPGANLRAATTSRWR